MDITTIQVTKKTRDLLTNLKTAELKSVDKVILNLIADNINIKNKLHEMNEKYTK